MPNNCNTDLFSQSIENHTWVRNAYNILASSVLLKNILIKKEIGICSKQKKGAFHVFYPGFGLGQLFRMFNNPNKYNVFGIDKNQSFVTHSTAYFQDKEIKNIYCKTQDMTTIEYEDTFDIALIVNVLNYIEKDVEFLMKIQKSLAKKGVVVVFNASSLANEKDKRLEAGIYQDEKFRFGYSKEEIVNVLHLAGFKKLRARYVYGVFGVLSWKITTGWPSFLIKATKLSYLLIPFYIILLYPFALLFNFLELLIPNKSGKCVMVRAYNTK